MRPTRILLLATLALAGCGKPDLSKPTAKSAAAALGSVLPRDMGGGIVATSATSDGAVLVLQIENLVDRGAANNDETATAVKGFACRNTTYRTLVSEGVKIRFNATDTAGRHLPPIMLDTCT
jgi:hypothetical protein